MAKRAIKSGTATRARHRTSGGTAAENGENRPALAVKPSDKGHIFSHIRQQWLAETPEECVIAKVLFIKVWVEREMCRKRQWRRSGGADIANLPIPLPPLPIQQQIVEQVAQSRAEIAKLKADAKARADAARAYVEAMILGTKPVA